MKKDTRVPIGKEELRADLKESLIGHPVLRIVVHTVLFALALLLFLVMLKAFIPIIGILVFLLLGIAPLFIGVCEYVRGALIVRRFSVFIDKYPSPLTEMKLYRPGVWWNNHGRATYKLRFPRGKWTLPYLCYTWRGPDAMRVEDFENRIVPGELFYVVRDRRGDILYAYNAKEFLLSDELDPYIDPPLQKTSNDTKEIS